MERNPQTIGQRLALLVDYQTGGNRVQFAGLMGWTKQYLNKLLNGDAVGLAPVLAILGRFPELDARWLLTGEGRMLDAYRVARRLIDLEEFVPVMSQEELANLAAGRLVPDQDQVDAWRRALETKNAAQNEVFRTAYKRQNLQIVCK